MSHPEKSGYLFEQTISETYSTNTCAVADLYRLNRIVMCQNISIRNSSFINPICVQSASQVLDSQQRRESTIHERSDARKRAAATVLVGKSPLPFGTVRQPSPEPLPRHRDDEELMAQLRSRSSIALEVRQQV